jgi:hypothetical protein
MLSLCIDFILTHLQFFLEILHEFIITAPTPCPTKAFLGDFNTDMLIFTYDSFGSPLQQLVKFMITIQSQYVMGC